MKLISLAIIAGLTLSTTPAIAKPKPTLAEIEAAKQAEAAKKAAADAARAEKPAKPAPAPKPAKPAPSPTN